MAKRKTKPVIATTWSKPAEWSHIPGEPTRPPIVPSWAVNLASSKIAEPPAVPLAGYQEDYIGRKDRFVAWLKARQIGGTFTTMLKHVIRVQTAEAAGNGHRAIAFSAGKDAARENVSYATIHARAFEAFREHELAVRESEEVYADDPERATYSKFSVEFPGSGFSKIEAIAANPYTAVGRSANIVGDEVSRWRDARKVWDAVVPMVTRGNLTVDLCSTPLGTGNLWHDIATNPAKYGVSLVTTNVWDAVQDIEVILHLLPDPVAQRLRIDVAKLYKLCGDDKVWAQNFLCQFLDLLATLLPLDLIAACEADGFLWPTLEAGKTGSATRILFAGWDVARKRDLSVVWIFELLGDVLVTRWIEIMTGMPYPQQKERVDKIVRLPGMRRLLIDQTGVGLALKEFSEATHGSARVGGVTFTGPARVELAKQLKGRAVDKRLRLPREDSHRDQNRDDFRLVQTDDTLSSERIIVDETGETHADRFWAACLGNYAAFEFHAGTGTSPAVAPKTAAWSPRGSMKANPAAALADRMLRRAG